MTYATEQTLLSDYIKFLSQEEQNLIKAITDVTREPTLYAELVGSLRQLRVLQEEFLRLKNIYYPR